MLFFLYALPSQTEEYLLYQVVTEFKGRNASYTQVQRRFQFSTSNSRLQYHAAIQDEDMLIIFWFFKPFQVICTVDSVMFTVVESLYQRSGTFYVAVCSCKITSTQVSIYGIDSFYEDKIQAHIFINESLFRQCIALMSHCPTYEVDLEYQHRWWKQSWWFLNVPATTISKEGVHCFW